VKFEFDWKSNSNSYPNLYSNLLVLKKPKCSQVQWTDSPSFASQPAQPVTLTAHLIRAAHPVPPHPLSRGPHPSAPPLFPFLSSYRFDHRAGHRARPGRAAGPARPARETGRGRAARLARTPRSDARGTGGGRGKGEGQLCPAREHPRRLGCSPGAPPAPARRRCQGH
jgi:hypothetical protein